jgi:dTMP kinase
MEKTNKRRLNMGKLIVFEGTDGSGKSTQFHLLNKRLEAMGQEFRTLVFPQYSEPSSALIRMYLGGEFGSRPSDVNAYAASTFYAVDRYASYQKVWKDYYEKGGLILSDRYTTSNAVHQASKVSEGEREEFLSWLYDFEYGRMELPKPDIVIYLDVPTELAGQMLRKREASTQTHADIHEQHMDYLRQCRETGLEAAKFYHWTIIHCAKDGKMRSIEEIHQEIFSLVQACLED